MKMMVLLFFEGMIMKNRIINPPIIKIVKFFSLFLFLLSWVNVYSDNNNFNSFFESNIYLSNKAKIIKDNITPYELKKRLRYTNIGSKENFNTSLKLSLIKNNKNKAFDLFPIAWQKNSVDNEFWHSDDNIIIGRSLQSKDKRFFDIKLDKSTVKLKNYDEIWIDYQVDSKNSPCDISLSLNIDGLPRIHKFRDPEVESWFALYSGHKFEKFSTDVLKNEWLKKDLKYSISKFIGLETSNKWRYSQDSDMAVLQRPMNWPVNLLSSIQINHKNTFKIQTVNFTLGLGKDSSKYELISVSAPSAKILENGKHGIEIDLGKLINEQITDEKIVNSINQANNDVYLKELFLHIEADVNDLISDEFIESVSLSSKANELNTDFAGLIKSKSNLTQNGIWKEKTIISRFINKLSDQSLKENYWFFDQSTNKVDIDRNLQWPLSHNSKLVISLSDLDTENSRIQIKDLSLTFVSNDLRQTVLISEPKLESIGDKDHHLSLNLNSILPESFSGIKNKGLILENIQFSFRGDIDNLVFDRKIREIALYESKESSNRKDFFSKTNYELLNGYIENINQTKKRLRIDLSNLSKKSKEIFLKDSFLTLAVPYGIDFCQTDLGQIFLVSTNTEKIPNYIEDIININENYGGSFLTDYQTLENVERVNFIAYSAPIEFHSAIKDTLTNITIDKFRNVLVDQIYTYTNSSPSILNFLKKTPSISRPDLENNLANYWASTDGLVLEGDILSISPNLIEDSEKNIKNDFIKNKGVLINGRGSDLNIIWDVQAKIDEESQLFLSVSSGQKEINQALLQIKGANGQIWEKLINANIPISLNTAPKEIQSILIKLQLQDLNYELGLDELLIFRPEEVNYSEALNSQFPLIIDEELISMPMDDEIKILSNNFSYWSSGISSGKIETPVKNPLSWLENISISYSFPSSWIDKDKCVLEGEFIFSDSSLRRSFCTTNNEGRILFNVAELNLMGHENLEKIIWHFKKKKGQDGQMLFKVDILSRGLSSIYNQIKNDPLIEAGRFEYYLDNSEEIFSNVNNEFSSYLSPSFFNNYIIDRNVLKINKNPWIKVEAISLSPNANINVSEWINLISKSDAKRSNFPQTLAILVTFFIFFLNRSKLFLLLNKFKSFINLNNKSSVIEKIKLSLNSFWVPLLNLSSWIYFVFGLLVLLFLLISAINSTNVIFMSVMLLSSGVLITSVYVNWKKFGLLQRRSKESKLTVILWLFIIVWIITLAFLVLTIENFKSYFILPVIFAIYGLIPGVFISLRDFYRSSNQLFRISCWGFLVIALYFFGFLIESRVPENYLINFAGVFAVLLWRDLYYYIRPKISFNWAPTSEILDRNGIHFFIGAVFLIFLIIPIKLLELDQISEQISTIVLYMLIVGTLIDLFNLNKNNINTRKSAEK